MTTKDTRRYEMLVRVHEFGAAHTAHFPDGSVGGNAFSQVKAVVTRLGEHAVATLVTAKEGTRAKAQARDALIAQLDTVGRTARVLVHQAPALEDALRRGKPRSDRALITVGLAFARDVEPCERQFIAHGMPVTFLADLRGAIAGLEAAVRQQEAGRSGQTAARVSIAAAWASGLGAVHTLDAVVANILGADPAALAVWAGARRVELPRHGRRAILTTAASAPSAAPATPVVPVVSATAADASQPGIN